MRGDGAGENDAKASAVNHAAEIKTGDAQSESSRSAASLAGVQYKEGVADYLILLAAERERLAAEDAQAVGETDQFRGVVAIYKALGGGWGTRGAAPTPKA